jgi:hypothetical protein
VNSYDLYLYIDGVPTVDQVNRALEAFAPQWDGQMGWWVTDPTDRGSGVRCGLLVEPPVAPLADRLTHPAMAAVVFSTDGARADKDFVNQLNMVGCLQQALGGSVYDPQGDTVLATPEELSQFSATKVVQYFNQGESFQREVEAGAEARLLLGGDSLWEPSDAQLDEVITENRGMMITALVTVVLLMVFIGMAIQKSCGG